MTYTDAQIQWVDAVVPNLPINRFFNVDDIVQSSLPVLAVQNQSHVSEFLDNFLRDNSFVVENLLSIYYADDVDKVYLDLTVEGKRLKYQGSYEKYLLLLKKEEKSKRMKLWKENINLGFSTIAAITGILALFNLDYFKAKSLPDSKPKTVKVQQLDSLHIKKNSLRVVEQMADSVLPNQAKVKKKEI